MSLAVCAIVKNEERRIAEWIAFHQIVGVSKFFLYDNGSNDNTAKIAKRFDGVTVMDWAGTRQQLPAYHDALTRYEMETDWLAFIDADEFLWSPTGLPLPTLLEQRYAEQQAIGVCWLIFGTSGLVDPPALRLDSLIHRVDQNDDENSHVKTILRPSEAGQPEDPHHFDVRTVDETGTPFSGSHAPAPSWDLLRINHYMTGSIPEALEKSRRLRVDTGEVVGCEDEFLSARYNAVRDVEITRYLPLLKARLA